MYFNSLSYSTCNWLNGIPLWNNKGEELVEGLTPSCQINYNYISIINYPLDRRPEQIKKLRKIL